MIARAVTTLHVHPANQQEHQKLADLLQESNCTWRLKASWYVISPYTKQDVEIIKAQIEAL